MKIPPRLQIPFMFAIAIAVVLLGISFLEGSILPAIVLLSMGALAWGASHVIKGILFGIEWKRPVRFLDEPIPDHWEQIITQQFPLYTRLDDEEKQRLLKYVQLFLSEKNIEGAGGFEITEEVRLCIAAQACILLVNMGVSCYPRLRTIIVYEGAYQPGSNERWNQSGDIVGPESARLGESWTHGTVVLSWQATEAGAKNIMDGQNLVFHEFAHQLDQEDGVSDGVPLLQKPSTIRGWGEVIGTHYEQLKTADRKRRRTVLQKYGATNRAEFFAVATEAFFEKPYQVKDKHPELYEELKKFYGHDPAAWG